MREIIHHLQKKDASQRLEISRLRKLVDTEKENNSILSQKVDRLNEQAKRDKDYLFKLDNQLSIYKEKCRKLQQQSTSQQQKGRQSLSGQKTRKSLTSSNPDINESSNLPPRETNNYIKCWRK